MAGPFQQFRDRVKDIHKARLPSLLSALEPSFNAISVLQSVRQLAPIPTNFQVLEPQSASKILGFAALSVYFDFAPM